VQVEPADDSSPLASEDLADSASAGSVMAELSAIRRELTAQAEEINYLQAKLETIERSHWIRRWPTGD
jgi:hypothetical protein